MQGGDSLEMRLLQDDSVLPTLSVHLDVMPFIWTIAIDLTVFFALYKYRRYPILLHIIGGLFCALVTIITSIPTLIENGIPDADSDNADDMNHYMIGIVIYILLILQVILGLTSFTLRRLTAVKSLTIFVFNKIHSILGYALIILCKLQAILIIYIADEDVSHYWFNIFWDVGFGLLFIIRKLTFPKLEGRVQLNQIDKISAKVSSHKEIEDITNEYIIFANGVYDLKPILHDHPVGRQIIMSVKRRDIDRYVYGMYTSETSPGLPLHSHSLRSLSLLDPPIANISIPEQYQNFINELNDVEIDQKVSVGNSCYHINLLPKFTKIEYLGYEDVRQLGRYYSLTINESVTRLYTTVNFLSDKNIEFLNLISSKINVSFNYQSKHAFKSSSGQTQIRIFNPVAPKETTIPLLMKKYSNSRFTEQFIEQKNIKRIQISRSKGLGLQFAEIAPGKVVIIAGGTGLYPFSDLLDLLFKNCLLFQSLFQANILEDAPILRGQPFKNFNFQLLLSVQSLSDIHPITLTQIKYISNRSSSFKVSIRLRNLQQADQIGEGGKNIAFVKQNFQNILEKIIEQSRDLSMVWVCGPPRLNEAMSEFFSRHRQVSHLIL